MLLVGRVRSLASRRLTGLHRDPLTGLRLRTSFMRAVRRDLAASATGRVTGVLYVDIDGLKRVNDTVGHHGGDAVLTEVAARLAGAVGRRDVVARMGGDEFAVLVRGLQAADEVNATAAAVLAAIAAPWPSGLALMDGPAATASIGVAIEDGSRDAGNRAAQEQAADELVRSADLAMLRAKRRGGAHAEVFLPVRGPGARTGARAERSRTASLAAAVEHALAHETFDLRYQPVFCVRCGGAVRVEALLRVLGADGVARSPGRLLSAAEATGRLDRVTAWVLARALADARRWWPERHVPVAVNTSATELAAPSGPGEVLSAVRGCVLPAGALVLEVHRPDSRIDIDGLSAAVAGLAAAGVHVVLEDVEARWPPAELAAVQPAGLSLRRGSLEAALDQPSMAATVQAVLHMADSLRASVTAKTIETPAHLEAAVRAGCSLAQGSLLAPVAAADELVWRTSHLTMRDADDPLLTGTDPLATVHPCTAEFSYADRALAETQRSRDPSSPPGPGGFSRPRDHHDAAEES